MAVAKPPDLKTILKASSVALLWIMLTTSSIVLGSFGVLQAIACDDGIDLTEEESPVEHNAEHPWAGQAEEPRLADEHEGGGDQGSNLPDQEFVGLEFVDSTRGCEPVRIRREQGGDSSGSTAPHNMGSKGRSKPRDNRRRHGHRGKRRRDPDPGERRRRSPPVNPWAEPELPPESPPGEHWKKFDDEGHIWWYYEGPRGKWWSPRVGHGPLRYEPGEAEEEAREATPASTWLLQLPAEATEHREQQPPWQPPPPLYPPPAAVALAAAGGQSYSSYYCHGPGQSGALDDATSSVWL